MKNFVLHVSDDFKRMPRPEKKKKAMKLHQQFAHSSKERLLKLIENSKGFKEDDDLKDLIHEVSDECEICERFKKPNPRPVVGMSLVNQFNETVCMDLFEF